MQEKVIYREGISATVNAVRAMLPAGFLERLRTEAGYDHDGAQKQFPIATFDAVVKLLAAQLYPAQGLDDALYELGRTAMTRYGDGAIGKTLFPLIRLLGPVRVLKRIPPLFRATNNFAVVTLEVTGKTSYECEHNEVGSVPHYYRGVMQGAAELLRLPHHQTALLTYDGHRARYRLSWQP